MDFGGLGRDTTLPSFDDPEAVAVWRILEFHWRVLATVAGVLTAGLLATEFRIQPAGYTIAFAMIAVYCRFGYSNAKPSGSRNPRHSYCLIARRCLSLVLVRCNIAIKPLNRNSIP
jgi:hypothetical protein